VRLRTFFIDGPAVIMDALLRWHRYALIAVTALCYVGVLTVLAEWLLGLPIH
jgi:hypothetical protein